MKVSKVMSTRPVTVQRRAPVREALRLLAEHQVTTLPVVDARRRIVGVVGEADLLDCGAQDASVDQVMRHATVLAHPETDVDEVRRVLRSMRVKSLPVVDASDQVVGMVSRSDIVRMMARDDELLSEDIADGLSDAGLRGWRVDVHDGVADLTGPDGGDESLARRTAQDTLGVRAVRID